MLSRYMLIDTIDSAFHDRKITFAIEAARQAMCETTKCGLLQGVGSLSLGIGLELFSLDDMAELHAGRTPKLKTPASRLTYPAACP